MRREAAPSDCAGEAQPIQNLRIVVGHAAAKNVPLPRICGRLESLELAQNFQHAALAEGLRSGREVLPAKQPAHELRGADRLNLVAQFSNRELVNARQETTIAPLGLPGDRACKLPAQDDS